MRGITRYPLLDVFHSKNAQRRGPIKYNPITRPCYMIVKKPDQFNIGRPPVGETAIIHRSGLSFKSLGPYLELLAESGLLVASEGLYQTTDRVPAMQKCLTNLYERLNP